jgi:acylphosphatase
MAMEAVHMIVHGRVQGVGFRFFVREQATRLGVKGWVKNLPDGTVEIEAQGEKSQLEKLIDQVKQGPSFGNVDDININWKSPESSFSSFSIEF